MTLYLASISGHSFVASCSRVNPKNWFRTGSRSNPTRSHIPPNHIGGSPIKPSMPKPPGLDSSSNKVFNFKAVLIVWVLNMPSSSMLDEFKVISLLLNNSEEPANSIIPSIWEIPVFPVGKPAKIPKMSNLMPLVSSNEPKPS